MKVQCDVCEKAAATLLCCADEAALCGECDKQVHAANKLAEKHERVALIGQNPSSCDICQEKFGHFFCVEDRALLCRDCDVSIHTTNELVRKHNRFLVSGVQVELHAMAPQPLAPPPNSPHLLVCKPSTANSIANITMMETMQQMVPNAQEAIWPRPPPSLVVCKANSMENIHASLQTLKHMVPNPQATTWPCPLIPPITLSPSHPQQLASPPSMYFSDCMAHLDELLNINNNAIAFTETSSKMSIPNLGWALPNNMSLAWDVLNASTYLFEDSLAEVPSTQSPSIQDPVSLKRKRPMDELTYSTFDHPSLVPNSIFPCFKERKNTFYGGIGG